jgi:DNA primase
MSGLRSAALEAWSAKARAVRIEDEIARRGIKLKRTGIEHVGPCPKCGGEDRFAINVAKQVFHCRGCDVGGDVIKLVEHLDGLDFIAACTALTGEPPPKGNGWDRTGEPRKIVAAEFRYADESGKVLLVVERVEFQNPDGTYVLTEEGKRKKAFRQRRPDPERPNHWLWNVNGVPPLPYRLPELIGAAAAGSTILVVEGEAKVDLLRSMNIPATCCAGGAKKWRTEHTAFLRGAQVVIMPDNDDVGRAHMNIVAASLQGIAASIRVLDLPGLPPKGDRI